MYWKGHVKVMWLRGYHVAFKGSYTPEPKESTIPDQKRERRGAWTKTWLRKRRTRRGRKKRGTQIHTKQNQKWAEINISGQTPVWGEHSSTLQKDYLTGPVRPNLNKSSFNENRLWRTQKTKAKSITGIFKKKWYRQRLRQNPENNQRVPGQRGRHRGAKESKGLDRKTGLGR